MRIEIAAGGVGAIRAARGLADDAAEGVARSVDPKSLIGRQGREEMSGSQVERLRKDMKANGYDNQHPIDAADVDGKLVILDGHHRAQAAAKAGIQEVPVNVHAVTPDQKSQLLQEVAEVRSRN